VEQKKELRKRRVDIIRMLIFLFALGAAPAIISLLLYLLTTGDHELRTSNVIFLVIPLLLYAVVTGNIKSLDLFGPKADFSDLWAEAGQTEIRPHVSDSTLLVP
jgi:hypothetical protein